MDTPIHAANEVDKGEMVPKIVAAAAGILIIAIVTGVVVFSGTLNPPPTTMKLAHTPAQTQTR